MGKPYDATTRNLIEMNPADWLVYLGHPVADPGRIRLIDSNLSTISPEVDRVIRLEDPFPWLWNLEFQAGRDLDLAFRLHFYSTLLHHHYKLPVRTSLVLLREAADGPELTGLHQMRYPTGEIYDWFRYDVVKVWEQPVEKILAAGLTVLPLAPVARVEPARVPDVLMAISARFEQEITREQAGTFWDAIEILMGLRFPEEEVGRMIQEHSDKLFGIRGIEESSVYQGILRKGEARGRAEGEARGRAEGEAHGRAEGALEEARRILIRHGTKKFGPPDQRADAQIVALDDLDRLHDLVDRVLDVATWDELLADSPKDSE